MKKIVALLLVLVMACALFAACGEKKSEGSQSDKPAGEVKPFVIGGIGPLTGGAATYGNAAKNGAEIAVEEINALKGDVQFTLYYEDDEHDPEKSLNAYNTLKDKGLQILLGTVTTSPCIEVSAQANADRIFELTPSASSTDVLGGFEDESGNITIARKDNVFQMCFTDPNQGIASAEYIKTNNIGTKVAVIYKNDDAYSTGIYQKFISQAAKVGLEVVSITTFTADTATDFSVQLADAKNNGADLVFLPIYFEPASLILAQANSMGYEPAFFGVDGMDGILTMKNFDVSLAEGVFLLTPFSADAEDEQTKNFVSTYQSKFGEIPNQFAADGYDTVYALYNAIKKGNLTSDMTNAELCEKLIGIFTSADFKFDGLTGSGVTWATTGEVSKAPKAVVIKDGVYVGYNG
ncbi:MAG: ABC transporter substrate-binding protein [Clostridia bacterium]|nr:ABC transporter substrate-binding protein [Clostridia bacterium]